MSENADKAVVILGMHRSGTSAVARCLESSGVYLGPPAAMIGPSVDNPKGFFELTSIVAMHEQLLAALDRGWDSSVAMPPEWWTLPEVAPFFDDARRVVESTFAGQMLWGWKDPRTCLALPLWQRVLAERGTDVRYVLVCRNPLDIAASLQKRNGFTPEKSIALYVLHMLHAFYHTRDARRSVVFYEQWLDNGQEELDRVLQELDLPSPDASVRERLAQQVDPALAHNRTSEADTDRRLTGIGRRVHELTRRMTGDDAEGAAAELASLLADYESFSPLISSQVEPAGPSMTQVFDFTEGSAAETRSVSVHLHGGGQVRTYVFPLPWPTATHIRFDPTSDAGLLTFQSIELWEMDGQDVEAGKLIHRYTPEEVKIGQQLIAIDDPPWSFVATGPDPQLFASLRSNRSRKGRALIVKMSFHHQIGRKALSKLVASLADGAPAPSAPSVADVAELAQMRQLLRDQAIELGETTEELARRTRLTDEIDREISLLVSEAAQIREDMVAQVEATAKLETQLADRTTQLRDAQRDLGSATAALSQGQQELSRERAELSEAREGLANATTELTQSKGTLLRKDQELKSLREFLNEAKDLVRDVRGAVHSMPAAPTVAPELPSDVAVQDMLARLLSLLKHDTYVLALSHADYLVCLGGTEKLLREEQGNLDKQGISYLQLSTYQPQRSKTEDGTYNPLLVVNVDSQPLGTCSASFLMTALELLRETHVARPVAVHLHQLMHWPLPSVDFLLEGIHPPVVRFFLHDYASICPQFNLLRNDEEYCGGSSDPAAPMCQDCKHGPRRRDYFPLFQSLFERWEVEMIAPSQTAADVWRGAFPQHRDLVRVVPHLVVAERPADHSARLARLKKSSKKLRIAYIGYQADCKGWPFWRQTACDPTLQSHYDFYTLGACSDPPAHMKCVAVSFIEGGLTAMVDALEAHDIDIAFLWSIWSETYSYTAFEAMATNCLIITNSKSGNIAVLAGAEHRGCVFESEEDALAFLREPGRVRDAIRQALAHNGPLTMSSNPELALGTAQMLVVPSRLADVTAEEVLQRAAERGLANLVARLSGELHIQRGIPRQLEEIHELRDYIDHLNEWHGRKDAVIDYYRSSRVHRVAGWLGRIVRLGKSASPKTPAS